MRLVGDYVVPGDGTGDIIAGGAIDIDPAGRIVAIGSEADLNEAEGPVTRIGGLLMPGLVNAHAHGPMTLVRSAGDGMPLMPWLTDAVWPREGKMTPDDVVAGATLAFCEQLLAGVTTSAEMYLFEESVIEAAQLTGARLQIMAGILSVVVPDDDALEARFDAIDATHARHNDPAGRVTVGYGAHSVYDLGDTRLARIAERAAANGFTVHIHLEETQGERADVIEAYGRTATELLAESGLLHGYVVGAHGVWLSDSDIDLLVQADAGVVHCPQSNLKLGSGIARLNALRESGLNVGLGTDGAASNDSLNMWEDMRLAALLARGTNHDPGAITAPQALAMATRDSAAAAGIADVGELRPGAFADIVRLDLEHPAFASGVDTDRFNNLVWAGSRHHVSDVWVAGQHVVADGQLTTVDLSHVHADARQAANRLL